MHAVLCVSVCAEDIVRRFELGVSMYACIYIYISLRPNLSTHYFCIHMFVLSLTHTHTDCGVAYVRKRMSLVSSLAYHGNRSDRRMVLHMCLGRQRSHCVCVCVVYELGAAEGALFT
jgi:hypothetical protein